MILFILSCHCFNKIKKKFVLRFLAFLNNHFLYLALKICLFTCHLTHRRWFESCAVLSHVGNDKCLVARVTSLSLDSKRNVTHWQKNIVIMGKKEINCTLSTRYIGIFRIYVKSLHVFDGGLFVMTSFGQIAAGHI